MKLLIEDIEDFQILTEKKEDGSKDYYINGIFMQAEKVNRNNRIYPYSIMEKEVNKYINEKVNRNRAVGQLGHPQTPKIEESKISHIIKELYFDNNNVVGKAQVLNTAHGKELKALIDGGVQIGVSSRALGSVKERHDGIKEVQNDFSLCCVDVVLDPSAPDAWVDSVMESAEWLFIEGKGWIPQYIEKSQKIIHNTSKKELEETALIIWKNFVNNLNI